MGKYQNIKLCAPFECSHDYMVHLGSVWLSRSCGKKLLWTMGCGKAAVGCQL
jgi:hypothetical protein